MEKKVQIFYSFEDENAAEDKRRSMLTARERWKEFGILMERCWGKNWTKQPIKKVVSIEKINW